MEEYAKNQKKKNLYINPIIAISLIFHFFLKFSPGTKAYKVANNAAFT
jgi:hypothetical protein